MNNEDTLSPLLIALVHYFDSVCISHDGTEFAVYLIVDKSTHSFTHKRLRGALIEATSFTTITRKEQ